jgi:hypothetical protein
MLWHGYHEIRPTSRRLGCGFTQQRPDHGERCGIEPAEAPSRVLESLNPTLGITCITHRGDAGRQRRRGGCASGARLASCRRSHFLTQRAEPDGDPLESTITART